MTRKDIGVSPDELYPEPITADEPSQVTARETIADLEMVPCDDNAKYVAFNESDILEFFKGEITYEEYINRKRQRCNIQTSQLRNHMSN